MCIINYVFCSRHEDEVTQPQGRAKMCLLSDADYVATLELPNGELNPHYRPNQRPRNKQNVGSSQRSYVFETSSWWNGVRRTYRNTLNKLPLWYVNIMSIAKSLTTFMLQAMYKLWGCIK